MRRRWGLYLLAGAVFGVFDFYFQVLIYRLFPAGGQVLLIPILGVWLALVMPVALYEARATGSPWWAAAAGAATWCAAVFWYYLFMGVKLILIGEASRPEMHFSNRADPFYWSNVRGFFEGDFVSGVSEWMLIALVGGSIIGWVIGLLALRVGSKNP